MKNDKDIPANAPETWLRQTLGGYRPAAPADAWQRLAPHLPRRKYRRPFVFWLAWLAVGILVVLALFYALKSPKSPLVLPAAIEMEQSLPQALPVVTPESLEKKTFVRSAEAPAMMTGTSRPGNPSSKEKRLQSAIRLPQNRTVSRVKNVDFLKRETDNVFDFTLKDTISSAPFLEKNALLQTENPLEKLSRKIPAPLQLAQNPLPEVQLLVLPVLPKKADVRRFWFGVEFAPALFMQKNMGGMFNGPAFPETHPHPGLGWQAGVSLAAEPLKNWRVALGIRHLRQTHEAAHLATLRLMDGVCLNPHYSGLKEYEFQYAIVSGGRESALTLRLQQQTIGSTMSDNEPFTLDMITVHRTAAWRLPLSMERRFGMGKWQGFVRGGVLVDFLGKSTVQVRHFTEACQELCFQSSHTPMVQVSRAGKTVLGWLGGAGIERQITRCAALRLEPFAVGQKGSMECGLSLGLLLIN